MIQVEEKEDQDLWHQWTLPKKILSRGKRKGLR